MECIHQIRKIKGLTLFEFNQVSKHLHAATVEKTADGKNKVVFSKDCFYLQALNLKSATHKLKQLKML